MAIVDASITTTRQIQRRSVEQTERRSTEVVCHCLSVTETQIVEAITTCEIVDVKELSQCTGAGQGCTACHRLLRSYISRHRRETAQARETSQDS